MRHGLEAGAAILLLTLAGCQPPKAAEAKKPEPPAKVDKVAKEDDLGKVALTAEAEERLGLKTAEVVKKPIGRTRTYAGDVIVPPGRLIVVSAPFIGKLIAPEKGGLPTPGTAVKKGQLILSLLPILSPEARATMATSQVDAEGQIDAARKALEVARINLDRAENLRRGNIGSAGALEDARAQHEIAETNLKNAQSRYDILVKTIKDAEAGSLTPMPLRAPEDGILRNVSALSDQQVAAGAILFEVERLDPVWVRVPVYVGDLQTIATDRDAEVGGLARSSGSDRVAARPVPAPPSADAIAATVDLFYEVANSRNSLRPGEKVGVTLPMKGEQVGLVVPKSAVYYDIQGGTWVYEKIKDCTYVRRRVEVDHVSGDSAALARGPKPGSEVVTVGVAELYGTEFGFSK